MLNNKKIKKLNLKFKKINKTTDVLTFVSTFENINYNKTKYCDIFFSAEKIRLDSIKNKISFLRSLYTSFGTQFFAYQWL